MPDILGAGIRAAREYADAVLALPALQEWVADARNESEHIEEFDLYD